MDDRGGFRGQVAEADQLAAWLALIGAGSGIAGEWASPAYADRTGVNRASCLFIPAGSVLGNREARYAELPESLIAMLARHVETGPDVEAVAEAPRPRPQVAEAGQPPAISRRRHRAASRATMARGGRVDPARRSPHPGTQTGGSAYPEEHDGQGQPPQAAATKQ